MKSNNVQARSKKRLGNLCLRMRSFFRKRLKTKTKEKEKKLKIKKRENEKMRINEQARICFKKEKQERNYFFNKK